MDAPDDAPAGVRPLNILESVSIPAGLPATEDIGAAVVMAAGSMAVSTGVREIAGCVLGAKDNGSSLGSPDATAAGLVAGCDAGAAATAGKPPGPEGTAGASAGIIGDILPAEGVGAGAGNAPGCGATGAGAAP